MAQRQISNGETGLSARNDLNDNFTELYNADTALTALIASPWNSISDYTATPASTASITTTEDLRSTVKTGMGLKVRQTYATRANNTSYSLNAIRLPAVATGYAYQVTVNGTSGANAPTWSTTLGGTTTDGGVTWKTIELYSYGIITAMASNQITIAGHPLTNTITELYYCNQCHVSAITYQFTDESWEQISTNTQTQYGNIPVESYKGHILLLRTYCETEDTGATDGKVKVMNAANHIYSNDTDGIAFDTDVSFTDSGVAIIQAYSLFEFLDTIRFDIAQKGSNGDTTKARITIFQLTL